MNILIAALIVTVIAALAGVQSALTAPTVTRATMTATTTRIIAPAALAVAVLIAALPLA